MFQMFFSIRNFYLFTAYILLLKGGPEKVMCFME